MSILQDREESMDSRVSFRFLPKRGQNKDICKVGGLVGASILPGF